MNQERLLKIILGPHVSEKTVGLTEKHRQHAFEVVLDATKPEIKAAVELLFQVKVDAVQVLNMPAKERRFRQRLGQQKAWKKAYVTLKEGFDINHSTH